VVEKWHGTSKTHISGVCALIFEFYVCLYEPCLLKVKISRTYHSPFVWQQWERKRRISTGTGTKKLIFCFKKSLIPLKNTLWKEAVQKMSILCRYLYKVVAFFDHLGFWGEFFYTKEGEGGKKKSITKFIAFSGFKHFIRINFLSHVFEICFYQVIRV
jgi:hypothetical protein